MWFLELLFDFLTWFPWMEGTDDWKPLSGKRETVSDGLGMRTVIWAEDGSQTTSPIRERQG
ncbi:hypothetical protein OP10G_1799 [Fimbriimonas ginsengisoli Gsoil 348]|uniref:Uncharacterized protein n=2 Tax=Fimbriimonas ginsengisoli TaxID=1005039 RepID=A0A068NP74_FIMGI|nr:hypothetical protein OP10G_1799 [Fimbriimonas ginsengisoli Gsoil 348]